MAKKTIEPKLRFKPGDLLVLAVPHTHPPKSNIGLQEAINYGLSQKPFTIPTEISTSEAVLRLLGVDPQEEKQRVDKLLSKVAIIGPCSLENYLSTISEVISTKGPTIVIDSITEQES